MIIRLLPEHENYQIWLPTANQVSLSVSLFSSERDFYTTPFYLSPASLCSFAASSHYVTSFVRYLKYFVGFSSIFVTVMAQRMTVNWQI